MTPMSSYYYIWQAAQAAQETGLGVILGGSVLLAMAWLALPICIPVNLQPIARRLLSWTILLIMLVIMTILIISARGGK